MRKILLFIFAKYIKSSYVQQYKQYNIRVIFSGCAGTLVGYPFDTIKVHLQTQDQRNPKYKGNWDCLRKILATESVFDK